MRRTAVWIGLTLSLFSSTNLPVAWAQKDLTTDGLSTLPSYTPINDLGTGQYCVGTPKVCYQGGLYENGTNIIPTDHGEAGSDFASLVAPINGKIVFLSLGMSNAQIEFGLFIRVYGSNPTIDPNVALINGAQDGIGACSWTVAFGLPTVCGGNAPNPYDQILNDQLMPNGLSESQVQVAWLKEANSLSSPFPVSLPVETLCPPAHGVLDDTTCADAFVYEEYLGGILRAAKQRYPNLKLVFISSRIYGGYDQSSKSHEPYAYEYGFSTKWTIQAQINQADRGRPPDPMAGDLSYSVAPWAAWGPYIWADGPKPRSDALVWCDGALSPTPPCNGEVDFQTDGVHPNSTGQLKVAAMLWTFFSTSPYSTVWFLGSPSK